MRIHRLDLNHPGQAVEDILRAGAEMDTRMPPRLHSSGQLDASEDSNGQLDAGEAISPASWPAKAPAYLAHDLFDDLGTEGGQPRGN
jgi:hypothetical protein